MGDLLAFPSADGTPGPTPGRRPAHPPRTASPGPEPLWREAAGRELRAERQAAGRTLADVARRAGVSTQYLSEVERGLKEPSSEVLGAVSGALGLRLIELTTRVARRLGAGSGPVCLAA